MKVQRRYILMIGLIAILCAARPEEKRFDEYQGGRFGYSGIVLKLYSDSTYYYSEWNHSLGVLKDAGKWGKANQNYYLNSKGKTIRTGRTGSSQEHFHFEMQPFKITGDTVKFVPKDEKDVDYFDAYYTLYKVDQVPDNITR